jgi:DNA polymerase-3 subunit beta
LPADVLATAISKTIFAAGNDDLRPVMSGVFSVFPEGLTFVATDAHKLVKYAPDVKASQVADFIMPKKPLTILKTFFLLQMLKLKLNTTIRTLHFLLTIIF